MSLHLLLIDPQNDFCDPNGSLFVPGADDDMRRAADLVARLGERIDAIHVTLDRHHALDISHPGWWTTASGRPPVPFTLITADDLAEGRVDTSHPEHRERSLAYLRALESSGRYPHTIWPEHCLIGDTGGDIFPPLESALSDWERIDARRRRIVEKGSNPFTEHFSAVRAEVPDPTDRGTQTNEGFIAALEPADQILVAGEAGTHCVMNTVADLAESFGSRGTIEKVVWLDDATSPVPDPPGTTLFSEALRATRSRLEKRGMRSARTSDFGR